MFYLGLHACEEALNYGKLHSLRITSNAWGRYIKFCLLAKESGVVIHREPPESLDRRCGGKRHQGILGEGEDLTLVDIDTLLLRVKKRGEKTLLIALDGISDPNNFGAIIRSAAGAVCRRARKAARKAKKQLKLWK